jgi:predicted phosphoribosyltransferase
MATRHMASQFENVGESFEKFEDMSPEEAGEAVGKFLKGLENVTKER